MADSRPNVLMFMTDQLRYDALACNGSPVAHTPNFDAVASRGVRCTDAFSQHSVCGPRRVSMLTGWYPHVAGHRTLTNLVKPYEPNLFALLRDAGYHVAWAGERGDMFAPGVADASTDRRGFAITPIVLTEPSPFGPDDPWFAAHYHGRRDGGADGPTLDFDEASVRTAIEWITDDDESVQAVDLWLSTAGGATFNTAVALGIPDTGSWIWNVPDLCVPEARIRVVARDAQGRTGFDDSDGNFVLRACIVNFRTSLEDIEALPEIVTRLGRQVDASLRPEKLNS